MDEEELALSPLHLGKLLLRWEGMRVAYNVLLLTLGFVAADILHPESLSDDQFLLKGLELALIANLCFCGAPLLELLVRELGLATPRLAVSLFLMRRLCSVFLLLASLFVWDFPHALSH